MKKTFKSESGEIWQHTDETGATRYYGPERLRELYGPHMPNPGIGDEIEVDVLATVQVKGSYKKYPSYTGAYLIEYPSLTNLNRKPYREIVWLTKHGIIKTGCRGMTSPETCKQQGILFFGPLDLEKIKEMYS